VCKYVSGAGSVYVNTARAFIGSSGSSHAREVYISTSPAPEVFVKSFRASFGKGEVSDNYI